jgi:hypothetical protein
MTNVCQSCWTFSHNIWCVSLNKSSFPLSCLFVQMSYSQAFTDISISISFYRLTTKETGRVSAIAIRNVSEYPYDFCDSLHQISYDTWDPRSLRHVEYLSSELLASVFKVIEAVRTILWFTRSLRQVQNQNNYNTKISCRTT